MTVPDRDDQQHEFEKMPADLPVRVAERLQRRDLFALRADQPVSTTFRRNAATTRKIMGTIAAMPRSCISSSETNDATADRPGRRRRARRKARSDGRAAATPPARTRRAQCQSDVD